MFNLADRGGGVAGRLPSSLELAVECVVAVGAKTGASA